jgi:uncharacterized protein (TIGR01777 family)
MRIVISGSSGLIGTALVQRLRGRGDEVLRLVRRESRSDDERSWDPAAGVLSTEHLDGSDAVINLSGAGIGDKRWSAKYKQLIYSSRIDSTRLLAATIADCARPPSVFISASGVNFYGDRGDEVLTEDSAPGEGFLANLVRDWEAAAVSAENAGVRVVHTRTGIVLDESSGAVGRMLLPFRLGLGGRLGDGQSWWSWVALEDVVNVTEHILDTDVSGPVNVVSPNPVRSADFTDALGDALNRPTILPIPKFALDLVLGAELSEELVFSSARVVPGVLTERGHLFAEPELGPALESLFA